MLSGRSKTLVPISRHIGTDPAAGSWEQTASGRYYNPLMRPSEILWTLAAFLVLVGVISGISSALQSIAIKKAKQRLTAIVCIGTAICIGSLGTFVYQSLMPTYELLGQIERAQIRTQGKDHRTAVLVRAGNGRVALDASGLSPYFQAGQVVRVRYQGVTGYILKAHFLSTTGAEVAVFNGTDTFPPYWGMALGAFVIFAGFRKYRRDPEAAEQF